MPVIKRYSNRKLYDTDSKRYVTLEDLSDFIRRGEDVRVVDHVTGEDLTSVTLLQVIFEEEKKIGGLLPQVFMTRLIRAGSGTVNALRSRIAAIDPFQMVDEEIRRRIQDLLEENRITSEEAQRWQDLLLRRYTRDEGARTAAGAGEAQQVQSIQEEPADPAEVETLLRQVETLEQELQRLRNSPESVG